MTACGAAMMPVEPRMLAPRRCGDPCPAQGAAGSARLTETVGGYLLLDDHCRTLGTIPYPAGTPRLGPLVEAVYLRRGGGGAS